VRSGKCERDLGDIHSDVQTQKPQACPLYVIQTGGMTFRRLWGLLVLLLHTSAAHCMAQGLQAEGVLTRVLTITTKQICPRR
jgi:hypothetical protein